MKLRASSNFRRLRCKNNMIDIERDLTNASCRLRKKAIEIIAQEKRPLAVQEIREIIRLFHSDMCEELSKKCDDYMRIILSLTKKTVISRYKSVIRIPGIDLRSTFYGLTSEKYPPSQWKIITNSSDEENPKPKPKNKEKSKKYNYLLNEHNIQPSESHSIFPVNIDELFFGREG